MSKRIRKAAKKMVRRTEQQANVVGSSQRKSNNDEAKYHTQPVNGMCSTFGIRTTHTHTFTGPSTVNIFRITRSLNCLFGLVEKFSKYYNRFRLPLWIDECLWAAARRSRLSFYIFGEASQVFSKAARESERIPLTNDCIWRLCIKLILFFFRLFLNWTHSYHSTACTFSY